MAGTSTVSVLISNSIPKIFSQGKPELYEIKNRDFIKTNPHSNFPKIIGVNFGNKKSSTRLLAGLSEVKPDLNEGKSSWPELVGVNGKDAVAVIERENPNVSAVIVKEGSFITLEFNFGRVRVFVDDNGIVVRTPVIG